MTHQSHTDEPGKTKQQQNEMIQIYMACLITDSSVIHTKETKFSPRNHSEDVEKTTTLSLCLDRT